MSLSKHFLLKRTLDLPVSVSEKLEIEDVLWMWYRFTTCQKAWLHHKSQNLIKRNIHTWVPSRYTDRYRMVQGEAIYLFLGWENQPKLGTSFHFSLRKGPPRSQVQVPKPRNSEKFFSKTSPISLPYIKKTKENDIQIGHVWNCSETKSVDQACLQRKWDNHAKVPHFK